MTNMQAAPEQSVPNNTSNVSSSSPGPNKKKGKIWLFFGIGALVLSLCCIVTLIFAVPAIQDYFSSQEELDYFIDTIDDDWVPAPEDVIPPPSITGDGYEGEENADLFVNEPGTLPFSSEFSTDIIMKDRLLDPGDGFGSELIAIGGNPDVYNFSILKPLSWVRDTMTTEEYAYVDPVTQSRVGVLHFGKDVYDLNEYVSCQDTVEALLGEPAEGITLIFNSDETSIVDGKVWDRIGYTINSFDGEDEMVVNGVDQCYKDEDSLFVVYSIFQEGVNKSEYQETILDDFIFTKVN